MYEASQPDHARKIGPVQTIARRSLQARIATIRGLTQDSAPAEAGLHNVMTLLNVHSTACTAAIFKVNNLE